MTKQEILEDLAYENDISVDHWRVPFAKAAIMSFDGTYGIVIDLRQITSAREETMIFAHELGHFMTSTLYREKYPLHNYGKSERSASKWAINFLVDFDRLKELLKEERDIHYIAEELSVDPRVILSAIEYKKEEWQSN